MRPALCGVDPPTQAGFCVDASYTDPVVRLSLARSETVRVTQARFGTSENVEIECFGDGIRVSLLFRSQRYAAHHVTITGSCTPTWPQTCPSAPRVLPRPRRARETRASCASLSLPRSQTVARSAPRASRRYAEVAWAPANRKARSR